MPIKTLLLYLAATHSLAVQKFIFHYSLDKGKTYYVSSLDSASFSHESSFKTVKTQVEYTNVGGYLIIRATIVWRCSNAPDLKADFRSVRISEISQQMPEIATFLFQKGGKTAEKI